MADGALRERCRELANQLQVDGMLRQNNPVDTIFNFVCAEIGKSADGELDDTLPLVLYFATEQDREDFKREIMAAMPAVSMHRVASAGRGTTYKKKG